jgi:hypothetical protein
VTVLLGPPSNRQELRIHKNFITARSEFFANVLSGCWGNSEDNTIDLYRFDPDLIPEDFAHYLEVVYTNKLNHQDPEDDGISSDDH